MPGELDQREEVVDVRLPETREIIGCGFHALEMRAQPGRTTLISVNSLGAPQGGILDSCGMADTVVQTPLES